MYGGLNAQGTRPRRKREGRSGERSGGGDGPDGSRCCTARVRVRGQAPTVGPSMTAHMLGGERPPTGAVWWALLALYLFAALAEAVVAGDDVVCAAACAAPALLAAVPGVGAALATVGTEYAAAALPSLEGETEEWHATMDAC